MEAVKIEQINIEDLSTNRDVNLSFGSSRFDTRWKNKAIPWSEFLERLQNPTVTQETVAEYAKMTKSKKGEIKDVGGFVGGFLKQGRRKSGQVQSRSIITLDADDGQFDLWDDFKMLADYAVAVYTTHSHTKRKPKFRFIIPLKRPVTSDEYEPIARAIANQFGMDNFDDTTYQPERLMYWPSVPRDGEFIFDYQDEDWLDPDLILTSYPDWRDSSYWPESSRMHTIRKKEADKQGDPLTKSGIVGAFCRTYDIHQAIEVFLPDIYLPSHQDDRYTYVEGSTSGGLVVYEGKFAYSHHGTDPVGDQLVNAFDLVRIHKYGQLDEDVNPKTNISKYPSQQEMQQFTTSLPEVRGTIGRDKLSQASTEFDEWEDSESESLDDSWLEQLEVSKQGQIEPTAQNLELIFTNDPNLTDKIYIDDFAKRVTLKGNLPWRKITHEDRFWKDSDDAGLRVYVEKTYGIVTKGKIDDALSLEFERNKFHPVRDYLDSLAWDGVERLETLLVDYLGALDTKYTRAVTRKFMVAAVTRIYRPGAKFDHMLVTNGPQGIGKTMLPSVLAGKWFSNSLDDVRGKDAYEALQGVWIMEMGEMTATRKADLEATKNFISKQEDVFRAAYGRHKAYHKRQCVFWGTSNDPEFLKDRTGNRRYWPVSVGLEAHRYNAWEMTKETRDQIWAETRFYYERGDVIYLDDEENSLAKEQQALHTEGSMMEGEIAEFLDIPITEDWYDLSKLDRRLYIQGYGEDDIGAEGNVQRAKISVAEVWNELYAKDTSNIHPAKAGEIRGILSNMDGWEKYPNGSGQLRLGPGYGRQVAYSKKIDDAIL